MNIGKISNSELYYFKLEKEIKAFSAKVSRIARAILIKLAFPLRYFGSKTWSLPGLCSRLPSLLFRRAMGREHADSLKKELFGSGYHFQMEKQLSKEELNPYLKFACANASVHLNDPKFIEPLGWKELKEERFFDSKTGLKIAIYEKANEIIVSFGALRSNECELPENPLKNRKLKQIGIRNAVSNLLGGVPAIYIQADKWMKGFLKNPQYTKKEITLSGQCYGGSFAAYLGLRHHVRAVCINSLQLGAGLQMNIGQKRLNEADKFVTHISVKNDYISDVPGIGYMDRIVSFLGLKTPGNFGRRFAIPGAYPTFKENHYYALGCMKRYLNK